MTAKIQAIQAALKGDWQNAIRLNVELLKENPNDIETLNRLAFAYTVLGKTKNAKNTYQTVLKIDSQNPIALKSLKKLFGKKNGGNSFKIPSLVNCIDSMFIEETGKTKVIELINIAESKIIGKLTAGELLTMGIKRLKIFILDENRQYIGMLPDDIGKRLIKFLKGGNIYHVFVKAIEDRRVSIFIKEVNRVSRFKNQPSFAIADKKPKSEISSKSYFAAVSDSEEESD